MSSKAKLYAKYIEAENLETWVNETVQLHGAINIFSVQIATWETKSHVNLQSTIDTPPGGESTVRTYLVLYMPIAVVPQQIASPVDLSKVDPRLIKELQKKIIS